MLYGHQHVQNGRFGSKIQEESSKLPIFPKAIFYGRNIVHQPTHSRSLKGIQRGSKNDTRWLKASQRKLHDGNTSMKETRAQYLECINHTKHNNGTYYHAHDGSALRGQFTKWELARVWTSGDTLYRYPLAAPQVLGCNFQLLAAPLRQSKSHVEA